MMTTRQKARKSASNVMSGAKVVKHNGDMKNLRIAVWSGGYEVEVYWSHSSGELRKCDTIEVFSDSGNIYSTANVENAIDRYFSSNE